MAANPFRIALNMAGAVSAGAYTAGVLDFLIEALDAWYDAREKDLNIPRHDICLQALTGASAGGMCAAISAVALKETFNHVKTPGMKPENANRLYRSWVETVDIMPLLGSADLDRDPVVRSILDCTPIEQIAATTLVANPAQRKDRKWVAEDLGLIVTISNLRGIPYSVDRTGNNLEERIGYHADQVEFIVNNTGATKSRTALPLGYPNTPPENWKALQTAAMATGAFPVALQARIVEKRRSYYECKKWRVSTANPGEDGKCSKLENIEPDWQNPPDTFPIVCTDGGMTNNNPFDCAHDLLVIAAESAGRLPRTGDEADAAVISVAPFPGDEKFNNSYDAVKESSLVNVISSLIPALISQSRFLGENLLLIDDPDVRSRFAIAPSDDQHPGKPALLCGALGAFGGFLDQKFRDRDYHLGRRNCQQFLRLHFSLPESNPIIAAGLPPEPARASWAMSAPADATRFVQERWFPIIPLVESVREEIRIPSRESTRTTGDRVDDVAEKAAARLKRVAHALIDAPDHPHPFWGIALNALAPLFEGKLKSYVRDTISKSLNRTGQLQ